MTDLPRELRRFRKHRPERHQEADTTPLIPNYCVDESFTLLHLFVNVFTLKSARSELMMRNFRVTMFKLVTSTDNALCAQPRLPNLSLRVSPGANLVLCAPRQRSHRQQPLTVVQRRGCMISRSSYTPQAYNKKTRKYRFSGYITS